MIWLILFLHFLYGIFNIDFILELELSLRFITFFNDPASLYMIHMVNFHNRIMYGLVIIFTIMCMVLCRILIPSTNFYLIKNTLYSTPSNNYLKLNLITYYTYIMYIISVYIAEKLLCADAILEIMFGKEPRYGWYEDYLIDFYLYMVRKYFNLFGVYFSEFQGIYDSTGVDYDLSGIIYKIDNEEIDYDLVEENKRHDHIRNYLPDDSALWNVYPLHADISIGSRGYYFQTLEFLLEDITSRKLNVNILFDLVCQRYAIHGAGVIDNYIGYYWDFVNTSYTKKFNLDLSSRLIHEKEIAILYQHGVDTFPDIDYISESDSSIDGQESIDLIGRRTKSIIIDDYLSQSLSFAHSRKLEWFLLLWPLAAVINILIPSISSITELDTEVTDPDLIVKVTGSQWYWTYD